MAVGTKKPTFEQIVKPSFEELVGQEEIPKTIYAQPVPLEDQIEAEALERKLRRQPVRVDLRGPQFPGGTPRDLGPSEPLVRYQRQLEERRRKIQEEEALELFYTTYPEKRPRKYKHFVDELLRNTGGGALNVASGLTGTLASVSEASIFDPEQLEGWAQKLHQKSKEPAFTPAKGGGWRGFVAASVGQAAPYMAAAVGATLLTGTPMAAFGVGYSVEGDNAYRTAIELGATEEEAQTRRFLVGTINGAIEQLQVSRVFKFANAGRGSAKGILKLAEKRAWKKVLQKGGKLTYEAAKHSAAEALEEVLQETTQIASEAKYNPKVWEEATQRIFMSGLGGGTIGLLLGGGGRVMTNMRAKAEAGKMTPQQLEVMEKRKAEYDAIVAEGGIGAKQKAEEIIRKGQKELAALEGEETAAAFEAEVAEMDREVREIQRPVAEVAKITPEPPPKPITPEIPPTVAKEFKMSPTLQRLHDSPARSKGLDAVSESQAKSYFKQIRALAKKYGREDIVKLADEGEIKYFDGDYYTAVQATEGALGYLHQVETMEAKAEAKEFERIQKLTEELAEEERKAAPTPAKPPTVAAKPFKALVYRGISEKTPIAEGLAEGTHYTTDKKLAKSFAEDYGKKGELIEKEITLENPLYLMDESEFGAGELTGITHEEKGKDETFPSFMTRKLLSRGYDGIVYNKGEEIVVFGKKSAPTPAKPPTEPAVEKPIPSPAEKVKKAVLTEPELTKKEIRQREIEAETEEAGISPQRRNRIMREIATEIKESDIYQAELEGLETKIGPGYYFVPETFRGEVEDIIGKRKGGLTKIQKMFTFDPHAKIIVDTPEGKREIGPLPWETAVQQALGRGKEGVEETWGEMDISDFVQQVKDSAEATEDKYGLSQTALDKISQRREEDPYELYRIAKFEMLREGRAVTEVDEMTREWAEHYGLDETEIENEFLGAEPLKLKEIKKLPEAEQETAIEALARENVLKQERQEAKQAVNDVLKANGIEVEVEEVAEIKEGEEIPFERRGKPTGAAIITPAGREIVQLAYGADSTTGYHEGYHILRSHLTPKDRKVLDMRFKGDQEAEAGEFAEFAKTGKATGYLRGIWRKLVEKLKKIKSALQGRGYRTAQDIFGEIQRGVVPKEGAAPGATQFERGVFGQPIQEQLRLPLPERQAAIKKVAMQEAREKIAERKAPKAKPTKKRKRLSKTPVWIGPRLFGDDKSGQYAIDYDVEYDDGYIKTIREHKLLTPDEVGTIRKQIKGGKEKAKPYEEWRPKGVVPIKTKLIKAVDAEIARTMKPRSNTVQITPEEIAARLRPPTGLFVEKQKGPRKADLFYEPDNPLPEITEAFNQLVKGGPLIQFETSGDRMIRESMRNARIKAEKARLKTRVKPKVSRARLKIKLRDVTPQLSREMGQEPGAMPKRKPERGKVKADITATPKFAKEFEPDVTLDELVAEPRDTKPKQKIYLTDKWFQENIKPHRKKAAMKPTSMASRSLKLLDKVLGSSSTRLGNIHPELKRQTRRYAFDVMTRSTNMIDEVEPFLKAMRKMSKDDYKMFDLALKNGYERKITELVGKYGLEKEYSVVRDVLDDLYNAAKEVGIDMEYRKDYWHRHLKDPEGFLEYFQKGDDWSIIEEAIKRRAERAGRTIEELTDDEKAQVVNTLLRGYRIEALTLARPGAAKARTVEVIDADLNQFYDDSASAMVKYVRLMNRKIAEREFFGRETKEITDLRKLQSARLTRLLKLQRRRGLKEGTTEGKYTEHISKTAENWKADQERLQRLTNASPENTIGGYVMDLQRTGQIKPSQEKELRDILQGIFYPRGMSRGMGLFATGVYIDTLNSPLQALTQLDEFAYSFYRSPTKSVPVAIRTALRKSKITPRDIGITSIGVEFQGPSMQRALSTMLKATGFEQIDRLNKENYINTALAKMQAQAKGKESAPLIKRLVRVFGKDYKNVLEDLRKPIRSIEDVSDDVKYLLFNELLDIQPVAITEMPEAYNKAGNFRILYALKTFYMKRLDFIRNECWQDMKSPKTFARGFGKLAWLALSFALFGAGSDALKDFIRGRKFDLKDSIWDNMLKMVFFSKYQVYKTKTEGGGRAVLETWVPPTKAIDAVSKDVITIAKGKDRGFELWRSVPLVGELYYWWFGRGREKIEAKEGKGWSEAEQ